MPPSWKHSREAVLWRRLAPAEASRVLRQVYGEGAGAEALLRAFLAERDGERETVWFWLAVHEGLSAPASIAGRVGISKIPAP